MKAAICLFLLLALSATSCEACHHGWFCWWVKHHKVYVETTTTEPEPATDTECASVAETAVAAELNTLVAAVTAADLLDTLGPDFVGTVFAPTEEAFAALLEALGVTAEELLANTELLTQVLLIHVVPDVVAFAADLSDGQQIPTAAAGVFVTVSIVDGSVFIVAPSGVRAEVVGPDVIACDAVVHVIDAVLTPAPADPEPEGASATATATAEATAEGDATTTTTTTTTTTVEDGDEEEVVEEEEVVDEEEEVVETEEEDVEEEVVETEEEDVEEEVVETEEEDVEDGPAATAEATATGDVTTTTTTTTVEDGAEEEEEEEECTTVVETAINAELGTLVAAVTAADLAEVIGPDFVGTVFAPTEEAFAALLAELGVTAEELLADTELLTQVLLIHVIPDVVAFSTDLEDGQEIPTAAEGVVVTVSIEENSIFIVAPSGVRAEVVTADIVACDAVVHVIGSVLTPAP